MHALAARPDTKIFATARDTAKASLLDEAAKKYGNITILTWRADTEQDSKDVKAAIEAAGGGLDVVIANAGKYPSVSPSSTSPQHNAAA